MVYERAHVESVLFCELVDAAAIKIVINNIVVSRLLCHLVTLSTSLILIAIGFFSNFEMGCQRICNQREIII